MIFCKFGGSSKVSMCLKSLSLLSYGKQHFNIKELSWYSRIPKDKRWIQLDVNENTEKVFLQWLENLIPSEE